MLQLTPNELDIARRAIEAHGYSTLLPEPPEWTDACKHWDELRAYLAKVDLDGYRPRPPLRIYAPKSKHNLRALALLHPEDLLIYTGLVALLRDDIESARVPRERRRVFSFRADRRYPNRLYGSEGSHQQYIKELRRKADLRSNRFVALADIADFYPRIYQHRLCNALRDLVSADRQRDAVRVLEKFLGMIAGGTSYGIPVGPFASRLLGEAVLIDVDSALDHEDIDFVRWVDDFNLFCTSEAEGQRALFFLAKWLYDNHGLTLQSEKTKVMTISKYRDVVLLTHHERLMERLEGLESLDLDELSTYDDNKDDGDDDDEIDDVVETNVKDGSSELPFAPARGEGPPAGTQESGGGDGGGAIAADEDAALPEELGLRDLLEEAVAEDEPVDYDLASFVLGRLATLSVVNDNKRRELLDFVLSRVERLYPVADSLSRFFLSFDKLTAGERSRIAKALLRPLKKKKAAPPDYYVMWILDLFARAPDWNQADDVLAIYKNTDSVVVKRYAVLALAATGDRQHVLPIKADYDSAHDLLRSAIAIAGRKLPKDEHKHWKTSRTNRSLLEGWL